MNVLKKLIGTAMMSMALLTAAAQTPRQILDATAATFTGKSGLKANFKADNFVKGKLQGSVSGTMCIQENKFQMTTPEIITWFNGTTQWSYTKANEEVNVSTPTQEELLAINPSTFVNLYKSGYNYKMKETTLRDKACYEITLTAQKKSNKLRTIILNVDKNSKDLMCIRLYPSDNKNCTRISIHELRKGQTFTASDFEFSSKDYPQAEVIDLR